MKFSASFICTLCVLILVLNACGKHKTLVEIGDQQQIIHINNMSEPSEIDPHITSGLPEYRLQMAVFEGLVLKDPKTLEPKPAVADSWTISEDGTEYTFHIRDAARWSDGDKVTAYDFEYSWKRVLQPEIGNEFVTDFFVIKNAEDYYKGKIRDFSQVGIKAINESTFQIILNNPTSYFLAQMDHFPMFPVQKKTIEKFNAFKERGTGWTKPENFVGNGPFIIKEWIPQVIFSVKRNPYYWDSTNVKLNEMHFYPYENVLLEERMFAAGQIHKTEFLPTAKVDKYRNSPAYRQYPFYASYYYVFNTKLKPLDDVRVRKALAYTIDRESIVKNILRAGQTPAYHLTPDDPYGYKPRASFNYDIPLAKKLLAEAGFPDGKGFPTLELVYNTHADHLKIAVAIQEMWKQNLGINITLRNMEWKVYLDARNSHSFHILRRGNVGEVVDPGTFLFTMTSDDPLNESQWGSKRYDELIGLTKSAKSQQERFEYFQEAEQILVDEMPLIPLYIYTTNNLVSPSVKGYYNNVLDYHPYKYLYLEYMGQ
ncbi:peptide ABC transporter substrate-binding protein [Cellvibrio zantedeschiae]|nr:peptide ABC transporter substrate-binding protein [Cellvibrio zantedeschiae]